MIRFPPCPKCGRSHPGVCRAPIKCYRCGQIRHLGPACPNPYTLKEICFSSGKVGHINMDCMGGALANVGRNPASQGALPPTQAPGGVSTGPLVGGAWKKRAASQLSKPPSKPHKPTSRSFLFHLPSYLNLIFMQSFFSLPFFSLTL